MTQDKTSRYRHPSQTTSLQALHEAPTSNPQKTFRRRPLGLEEIPVSVLDFNKELHSLCEIIRSDWTQGPGPSGMVSEGARMTPVLPNGLGVGQPLPYVWVTSPGPNRNMHHPWKGLKRSWVTPGPRNWCPGTLKPRRFLESFHTHTVHLGLHRWTCQSSQLSLQRTRKIPQIAWLALSSLGKELTDRMSLSSACCLGTKSIMTSKINSAAAYTASWAGSRS